MRPTLTMLGSGLWIMKTSRCLMLKSLRYRSIDSSIHSVCCRRRWGMETVSFGGEGCTHTSFGEEGCTHPTAHIYTLTCIHVILIHSCSHMHTRVYDTRDLLSYRRTGRQINVVAPREADAELGHQLQPGAEVGLCLCRFGEWVCGMMGRRASVVGHHPGRVGCCTYMIPITCKTHLSIHILTHIQSSIPSNQTPPSTFLSFCTYVGLEHLGEDVVGLAMPVLVPPVHLQ